MEVEFWENPQGVSSVGEFIKTLDPRLKKKIERIIGFFRKYGLKKLLYSGHIKQLHGIKRKYGYEIYELIILPCRIFFVIIEQTAYLLHAFIKKTDHTPQGEINVALKRINFLEKQLNICLR